MELCHPAASEGCFPFCDASSDSTGMCLFYTQIYVQHTSAGPCVTLTRCFVVKSTPRLLTRNTQQETICFTACQQPVQRLPTSTLTTAELRGTGVKRKRAPPQPNQPDARPSPDAEEEDCRLPPPTLTHVGKSVFSLSAPLNRSLCLSQRRDCGGSLQLRSR